MAASLALPASAAAPVARVRATAAVAHAAPVAGAAPSAAQAPLVPRPFGNIAFTGVVKPKPVVVERKVVTVSRSSTRSAIPAPAASSAGLLGVAASLAGIYYVYGGTTPAGFDCSGYTQYVFDKVGKSLPRTAEQQRQATTPVTNPQPGDLVFFGSPAHHVGIYAGNGKMWDSEQTGVPVMMHTDRSERDGGATYGRL
jgi:peptidoglycan DL-endopeptidase CwlO